MSVRQVSDTQRELEAQLERLWEPLLDGIHHVAMAPGVDFAKLRAAILHVLGDDIFDAYADSLEDSDEDGLAIQAGLQQSLQGGAA